MHAAEGPQQQFAVRVGGQAQRLADYLLTLGITTRVLPEKEGASVWIRDEGQVDRARKEFGEFSQSPGDAKYDAARLASEIRREEEALARQAQKRYVDVRANWGRMPHVLRRIDSARAAGLDVTADQYPYIASATSLDAIIPAWAHDGGTDSLLARLSRPEARRAVRDSILRSAGRGENMFRGVGGADGILIASVFADSLRYLQGQRVGEIARARRRDPLETAFDILLADDARTGAIYFSMHEADVAAALRMWWVAVNTDYGGVAPDGPFAGARPHPRTYGSFTRILGRYVRDRYRRYVAFLRGCTATPAGGEVLVHLQRLVRPVSLREG